MLNVQCYQHDMNLIKNSAVFIMTYLKPFNFISKQQVKIKNMGIFFICTYKRLAIGYYKKFPMCLHPLDI